MRRILVSLLLIPMTFWITACGGAQSSSSHAPTVSIEAQFQPLVDAFVAEGQSQGVNVSITDLVIQSAPDLGGITMGDCETDSSGASSPTIIVNQSLWDALDSNGQEALLFHELGHCVLNRVHDNSLASGLPTSLMNATYLGSSLYQANRSQYLHELFSGENLQGGVPIVVPQNTLLPNFAANSSSAL